MGVKVVKDLVNGYIYIDEKIQKCIDTPYFQRLHRVKQLTCNLLFPSVNHTRYEHSLGVMKLACDFWDTLAPFLQQRGKDEEEILLLREQLRFAALLHDVGHPAFSHLGEKFLEKTEICQAIREILPQKYSMEETFFQNTTLKGSPHELMSCYCILSKFQEVLDSSLQLDFVCRMIIGNPYAEKEKWAENICIQILNSSSIDVDKLDYLMRDNHMTGEIAPFMDVERLLASLSLDEENRLCFIAKAIPAVQSVVDSRDSLYLWVYHHHISVYTDFLLGEMLKTSIELKYMSREEFFSPQAITEDLIADDDVYSYLRALYCREKRKKSNLYLACLSSQFFERHFLKSLWKTIYEYHDREIAWMQAGIISEIEDLNALLKDDDAMGQLAKRVQKEVGLQEGEIFFVSQHHKFYHSVQKTEIELVLKGEKRKLSELLPQKNFEKFHQLSFFFYVKEEKKEEAYESFLKNLKIMLLERKRLL